MKVIEIMQIGLIPDKVNGTVSIATRKLKDFNLDSALTCQIIIAIYQNLLQEIPENERVEFEKTFLENFHVVSSQKEPLVRVDLL